jgi:peptidyl-prolyl cis-trans isomerase SDCCAG10
MSALYNLEPQPTASLILHTTSGEISLSLWAQQLPLTCRNFLQHCLDGYYDNTIFHRLVPGFIIQGGDPTGTGHGGESIYDGGAFGEENGPWPLEERKGQMVGFKDEWHSRIKYNRRGLLGMANEGGKDQNGSQFFLTLDNTPELQGKNTLFGRVEGDTIYNLAKMGEAEIGENERPLYPTRVVRVEVLVNPFKDMVPRKRTAEVVKEKEAGGKKKKRKVGGKQLLSFGDEEGDGDVAEPVVKKAKFDTRIVVDDEEPVEVKPKEVKKKAPKPVTKTISVGSSPEPTPPPKQIPTRAAKVERDISSSPEPVQKVSSLLDRTNAQIAELKASMKRSVQTAPAPEKKKSALEQMIPSTSVRGRKRHGGGNNAPTKDEQRTLDLLNAFKSKLDAAPPSLTPSKSTPPPESTSKPTSNDDEEAALCDLHFIADCQSCKKWDDQADEDEEDVKGTAWMSHALSFKEDKLGKDLSYRKKAEDELVVIDPREKARTLKEEMRAKREARAGGTGREWDAVRNEKMSRSSALAGRGAK